MNFKALEDHLINVGEQERQARVVFELPNSPPFQRQQALDIVSRSIFHAHTLVLAVQLLTGSEERARYYKDFYDQARSKHGFDNVTKKP
jgi:ParB-like chromosome segregation protein Spo0J